MESLQAVQQAWQIANGDYIDVPAFGAGDDGDSLVWDAGSGAFVKATLATSAALAAHIADATNPHGVTAAQVGSYTTANADSAIAAAVSTHAGAADPHTQYLLATGTRAGASSQAQTFENGVKTGKIIAVSDSTNAGGWYKANGTSQDVYYDSTNGRVGIGAAPSVALDIVGSNAAQFRMSSSIANDTLKNAYWQVRHYSNEQADVLAMLFQCISDGNAKISIGGGSGALNTVTAISFYTSIDALTKTGTERMNIDSIGRVGINVAPTGVPKFQVAGDVILNGSVALGSATTPTAFADIAASTTAAASMRIRSGDVVSSPNSGEIWYPTSGRLNFRRASTTEIFATGVQATGGAATATGSWTATEQGMLQKVYDAARAFGLLT